MVSAEELQSLKLQVEQARQQQARMEASREAAQAAVREAQTALQAEFGVATPEAAAAALADLERIVAMQAQAAREALARTQ